MRDVLEARMAARNMIALYGSDCALKVLVSKCKDARRKLAVCEEAINQVAHCKQVIIARNSKG